MLLQIDYMLAEELSKNNNDGYRGSQFLWKDAGGPLNFGPAWGLDDGFSACCGFPAGNYNSLDNPAIQPQGWVSGLPPCTWISMSVDFIY